MSASDPVIRPATRDDLERFYGAPLKRSMKAFVAEIDGEPVAVAGIAYQGIGKQPYLFSDLKPQMRGHKKAIVKGAMTMLRTLARPGLCAIADCHETNAPKLLARLGFQHIATTSQGDVFRYEGA